MDFLSAIKRKLSQAVQTVKNIFQPKLISPVPAPKPTTYTPPSFTYASPKVTQYATSTYKAPTIIRQTVPATKPTLNIRQPAPVIRTQPTLLQSVKNYFTPTVSGTQGFWGTPVAKGLGGIQKLVQERMAKAPDITLPKFKFAGEESPLSAKVAQFGLNLPSAAGEAILSAPSQYIRGVTKTGLNIGKVARGEKVTPQEILAGVAPLGESLLTVGTLGVGKTIGKELVKEPLKKTLLKSAVGGAKFMGPYGFLGGLQEYQEKPLEGQLTGATRRGIESAATGAILGPTLTLGGYGLAKGAKLARGAFDIQMAKQFAKDMEIKKIELTQHPVIKNYVQAFNLDPLTEGVTVRAGANILNGMGTSKDIYDIHLITNRSLPQFKNLNSVEKAGIWNYIVKRRYGRTPDMIPAQLQTLDKSITDYAGRIVGQAGFVKMGAKIGKEELPSTPAEAIKPPTTPSTGGVKPVPVAPPPIGEIPLGMKERGVMKTIRTAEVTPPELVKEVESITGKARYYKPYSDVASLRDAQTIIATEGIDTAKNTVLKGEYNKTNVATAEILVSKAMNEGRIEEATQILKDQSIKATKAGQANQAWSMWSRITPEGMLKYATKEILNAKEKMGFATKVALKAFGKKAPELTKEDATIITDLMKKANNATTEEEKAKFVKLALQTVSDKIPLSISEVFDAYRYNNMLSGLPTQEKNFFSNVWDTFVLPPATLVAEGRPIEAVKYELGAIKAIPKGLDNFVKSMRREIPIDLGKVELGKVRLGKLPRPLTTFSELMEASDKLFSTIIESAEVGRGVSLEEAQKTAQRYLLRRPIGTKGYGILSDSIDSMAQGIEAFGRYFKPVRWAVPFLRTPFDYARMQLEYSPFGALNLLGTSNKRNVIATTMLGSIATAIGAKLAMEGRATWGIPPDQDIKEWFYNTKRKPFAVRLNLPIKGETWVPAAWFGPFALSLLLPAAAKYYYEESKQALTDDDMVKLGKTLASVLYFWSQSSPMSNLGGFVKIMEGDIDFSVPKNIAFTLSQLKPYNGMLRYIANILDPIYRKPSGFGEQLISDIPGLTQNIKEYYKEPTGEPSKREPINFLLPWSIGTPEPKYEKQFQELQTIRREVEPFKKAEREAKKEEAKGESVEQLYTRLKLLPTDEANKQAKELKKVDPTRYNQLKQMVKDKKAGVGLRDEVIRNMELNPRANYLIQELNKISSKEEKNAKIKEWKTKGIVTDNVMKKLKEAKKSGTLKAPGMVSGIKGAISAGAPSTFQASVTEVGPNRQPIMAGGTVLSAITGGKGRFTQGFGARPQVYSRYGLKGHEGQDYVMPVNTTISNPFSTAVVEKVSYDPTGYGQYVGLRNPQTNEYVLMGHFNKINVKQGQTVNLGQAIGLSGGVGKTAGHSDAPHIHISYTPNYQTRLARSGGYGGFVNPAQFLKSKIT